MMETPAWLNDTGRLTHDDMELPARDAIAPQKPVQVPSRAYSGLPANAQLIEREPLRVDATHWLAAADLHAPLHDIATVRRVAQVADHEGIDTLIIQGDLFDNASISRHGRAEKQATLEETLAAGGAILDWYLDYFSRIYIVAGNHDERVSKRLDEPLSMEYLVRAAVKRGAVSSDINSSAPIITSDYNYLYVGEQETGWVVGHPQKYARVPTRYSAVAMRERRNVLLSHTHQQSMMWSDDGRYLIVDPGCCTDPALTPYVAKGGALSTYSNWKTGFCMVRGQVVTLMSDRLIDWGEYGAQ